MYLSEKWTGSPGKSQVLDEQTGLHREIVYVKRIDITPWKTPNRKEPVGKLNRFILKTTIRYLSTSSRNNKKIERTKESKKEKTDLAAAVYVIKFRAR